MKIIRAEFMGLCFGVRDALTIARETDAPESVTIYGELVHNPTIQGELASRGFRVVGEQHRDSTELTDRVMVTAHGISQKRLAVLSSHATEIIDTTCPLVRRVHEATQTLERENRLVILIGRRNHVEVQGIVEDLRRSIVVESPDEVIDWKEPALGIVSQSTTTPELAQRCLARILELNTQADVRYMDTICRPTRQRQQALEALCRSVSLVIVVGGKHSNNTRQLAERCTELGCRAVQVESAKELKEEWFTGLATVGLTAGTSTPDSTIEEVASRLASIPERKENADSAPTAFGKRWYEYFTRNLSVEATIPWSDSPTLSDQERKAVARSIQTFQLGETGSGRHFLTRSYEWGQANGDPFYHQAACNFIEEEHRHARWLGRFLEQEGIPKLQKQWTDSIFRRLRRLAGLRTSIAVLVSAEIMAQVYYRALKLATQSEPLKELCQQILREEAQHVRFQVQQLARIDRRRNSLLRRFLRFADRTLFGIASWIVYADHRRVFDEAGISRALFKKWCNRRWLSAEKLYAALMSTECGPRKPTI